MKNENILNKQKAEQWEMFVFLSSWLSSDTELFSPERLSSTKPKASESTSSDLKRNHDKAIRD